MSWTVKIGLCVALCALVGCAGADEGEGDVSESGGVPSGDESAPAVPVLDDVIPVAKVLRIRWTVLSACDEIEAERRTDAETFAPAFTAPGTDTDHIDEAANTDQTYTYRLRCLLGAASSDWSNTLSANPFVE